MHSQNGTCSYVGDLLYNNNEKVWSIVRVTKMWHRDRKWANAVGKMAPIDLLDTELHKLPFVKIPISVKFNKAKHSKTRYARICWSLRILRTKENSGNSFFLSKFILFIYFWLCQVFIAVHGLSLVVASRGYSSLWCKASHCGGFSCCRARALGARASVVVACGLSSCGSQALERRLSSCGARV